MAIFRLYIVEFFSIEGSYSSEKTSFGTFGRHRYKFIFKNIHLLGGRMDFVKAYVLVKCVYFGNCYLNVCWYRLLKFGAMVKVLLFFKKCICNLGTLYWFVLLYDRDFYWEDFESFPRFHNYHFYHQTIQYSLMLKRQSEKRLIYLGLL